MASDRRSGTGCICQDCAQVLKAVFVNLHVRNSELEIYRAVLVLEVRRKKARETFLKRHSELPNKKRQHVVLK